jgi:hypothetical protein
MDGGAMREADMRRQLSDGTVSRRAALLAGLSGLLVARTALSAGPAAAEDTPKRTASPRARAFDSERFVEDCKRANQGPDAQRAIQELLAAEISDPRRVLLGLGGPATGGIRTLHRSPALTVLNIVWAPLMQLMPHEHRMWSVIGIYTGREDNIFWVPDGSAVRASGAMAISAGAPRSLPSDVIHSVANPIAKLTGALHIYGGDFFATPRSEWDPDTLARRDWSVDGALRIFQESNDRFAAWQSRGSCG